MVFDDMHRAEDFLSSQAAVDVDDVLNFAPPEANLDGTASLVRSGGGWFASRAVGMINGRLYYYGAFVAICDIHEHNLPSGWKGHKHCNCKPDLNSHLLSWWTKSLTHES